MGPSIFGPPPSGPGPPSSCPARPAPARPASAAPAGAPAPAPAAEALTLVRVAPLDPDPESRLAGRLSVLRAAAPRSASHTYLLRQASLALARARLAPLSRSPTDVVAAALVAAAAHYAILTPDEAPVAAPPGLPAGLPPHRAAAAAVLASPLASVPPVRAAAGPDGHLATHLPSAVRAAASAVYSSPSDGCGAARALAMVPAEMVAASPFAIGSEGHSRVDWAADGIFDRRVEALREDPHAPLEAEHVGQPPKAWSDALAAVRSRDGKPVPPAALAPAFDVAALYALMVHRDSGKVSPEERVVALRVCALAACAPLPFYALGRKRPPTRRGQYTLAPDDGFLVSAGLADLVRTGKAVVLPSSERGDEAAFTPIFVAHRYRYAPAPDVLSHLYSAGGYDTLRASLLDAGRTVVASAVSITAAGFSSAGADPPPPPEAADYSSDSDAAASESAAAAGAGGGAAAPAATRRRRKLPPRLAVGAAAMAAAAQPYCTSSKPRMVFDFAVDLNDRLARWQFSYVRIAQILAACKRGSWVASLDISSAFHLVRMLPSDQKFMRARWPADGDLSSDPSSWVQLALTRLSFGLAHAPALFSTVSGALVEVMQRRSARYAANAGSVNFFVYMDDVFIVADTEKDALAAVADAKAVLAEAGAATNDKERPPAQRGIPILGIELDTLSMTISLPLEKRYNTAFIVATALAGIDAGVNLPDRFVAKLAGKLAYAELVVPGGRSRCDSIYAAKRAANPAPTAADGPAAGSRSSADGVDLSPARDDLQWWFDALCDPGRSCQQLNIYPTLASAHNTVPIRSDASGDVGAGLVIGNPASPSVIHWERWDAASSTALTIQAKELHPLVRALRAYGHLFSGLWIAYDTDNKPNVYALNGGTTADDSARPLLQEIVELLRKHSVTLVARWLPRELNILCDAISKSPSPKAVADALALHVKMDYVAAA